MAFLLVGSLIKSFLPFSIVRESKRSTQVQRSGHILSLNKKITEVTFRQVHVGCEIDTVVAIVENKHCHVTPCYLLFTYPCTP